jgi:hypothetical protein
VRSQRCNRIDLPEYAWHPAPHILKVSTALKLSEQNTCGLPFLFSALWALARFAYQILCPLLSANLFETAHL